MATDAVLERAEPAEAPDLDALLQKLPAPDRAESERVCKELLKGGKATVDALIAKLGAAADARARTALHGLALHVARPGATAERKAFAGALAGHLGGEAPSGVKAFVLQQLEYAGGPEVVAAVAKLLPDDDLGGPAARALVAIGGDSAAGALREALPKVTKASKVAVVQALGALRDKKAVDPLVKAAADADKGVRLAALRALGD